MRCLFAVGTVLAYTICKKRFQKMSDWQTKHFLKWWKKEQKRFHCGQFNDKEIAYSAWLAGIEHGKLTNNENIQYLENNNSQKNKYL